MKKEGLTYTAPYELGSYGLSNVQFHQVLALYESGLLEHCYCTKNSQHIIPKRYITELPLPTKDFDKHLSEIFYKKIPKNHLGWSSLKQQKVLAAHGTSQIFKFSGSTHPIYQHDLLQAEAVYQDMTYKNKFYQTNYRDIIDAIQEVELSDYISCCSNFVKTTYLKVGIPEENLDTLHLGVDTDYFYPNHIESDTFRILFIGFNFFRKGLVYVAGAFKYLKAEKKELTVRSNIAFDLLDARFFLDEEGEIKHFYDTADLFIFPTVEEGCAQVILEAAACGVPSLTTTFSGSHELFKHNESIFVYNDPLTCSRALQDIYDNHRSKLQEMGMRARKEVESHSWKDYRRNFSKWVENRM